MRWIAMVLLGACIGHGTIDVQIVNGLALDATDVYWGDLRDDGNYVKKASLAGGKQTVLVTTEGPAVDLVAGNQVFWRGMAGVVPTFFATPIDGGSSAVVLSNMVYGVATNGTSVVWARQVDGGFDLDVASAAGGAPTTIGGVVGPDFGNLAMDDTDVYVSIGSSITRVSLAGTSTVVYTSPTDIAVPIAVDADNIYWLEAGNVRELAKTGGTAMTIASRPGASGPMAVDATHVYWTVGPAIERAPIGGGAIETLVTDSTGQFAVDATSICWVADRAIHVLPK